MKYEAPKFDYILLANLKGTAPENSIPRNEEGETPGAPL